MAADSIKLKANTRKETVSVMEMNRRGDRCLPCCRGENIHALKKNKCFNEKKCTVGERISLTNKYYDS